MDLGTIGSIGSSIVGGLFGRNDAAANRAWQSRENKTAREFAVELQHDAQRYQTGETARNVAHDRETFRQQFGLNRQEQIRQFNQSRAEYDRQFAQTTNQSNRLYWRQRRDQRNDLLEQRRYDASQLQRLAADAKKAGIHPLAALGGAVNYSSPSTSNIQASGGSSGVAVGGSSQAYSGGTPAAGSPSVGAPSPGSPPIGGNPMGDAVVQAMAALTDFQTRTKQLEVLESEKRRNDAISAAALADSQSRTMARSARAAVQAGTIGGRHMERGMIRPSEMAPSNKGWTLTRPGGATDFTLKYPDRPLEKVEARDEPSTITVTFPDGRKGTGLNTDVYESEVASSASDVGLAAQYVWPYLRPTVEMMNGIFDPVGYVGRNR